MEFWQKVKKAFSSSVETISEKTSEWSTIAKLKMEQYNIQRSIDKKLSELGGKVYHLHVEKKENQLLDETKELIENLKDLEQDLSAKKDEITEIAEAGVDAKQLKEFRKDLELGDGAIEQVVVDESSAVAGKKLMDIKLPRGVLLGAIVRNDQVIIPDGQTVIEKGDRVTLIGEKDDVEDALQFIG